LPENDLETQPSEGLQYCRTPNADGYSVCKPKYNGKAQANPIGMAVDLDVEAYALLGSLGANSDSVHGKEPPEQLEYSGGSLL